MGRKLPIIYFAALLLFVSFAAHPYYLSVTDLKYNSQEKALQGTVKLFTSDLEDALVRLNNKKTDLINVADRDRVRLLLQDYVRKRLQVNADAKQCEIRLIGFENEEEATWLYVEIVTAGKPEVIMIKNALLYDFLPKQMNIVHLQVDRQKQSQKVSYPDTVLQFRF